MEIKDLISNVEIYGLENAIKGSKYPMATDLNKVNGEITKTVKALASAEPGSGHDNFLNGIIVQFDLTFTVKAWTEAERYHFLDFVSSQSTMHRIARFDLDADPARFHLHGRELVGASNAAARRQADKPDDEREENCKCNLEFFHMFLRMR